MGFETSWDKEKVISELKDFCRESGHSPQEREIPHIANLCRKYFGSFNAAKLEAGLTIKNQKVIQFPVNAFTLDKNLASIFSHITFDGHLYKNLRGLMFSSKSIEDIKRFGEIMKNKFGLQGNYRFNHSGSHKQTHQILFFNKQVNQFLFNNGLPKGNKASQAFDVPAWIKESEEFSREYLKIAYLCEGCLEKEKGRSPRISFVQSKCADVIEAGLIFMESLKSMLRDNGIESGKLYISPERLRRRDNKPSHDIRFRIKTSDSNRFIREIGWLK